MPTATTLRGPITVRAGVAMEETGLTALILISAKRELTIVTQTPRVLTHLAWMDTTAHVILDSLGTDLCAKTSMNAAIQAYTAVPKMRHARIQRAGINASAMKGLQLKGPYALTLMIAMESPASMGEHVSMPLDHSSVTAPMVPVAMSVTYTSLRGAVGVAGVTTAFAGCQTARRWCPVCGPGPVPGSQGTAVLQPATVTTRTGRSASQMSMNVKKELVTVIQTPPVKTSLELVSITAHVTADLLVMAFGVKI
ncbi:uncharacterized protein LOC118406991 [Branchiostoma floridae]|uniref:Uncharacterized protein LOC118406991 n=1 Tax=Branchiostoma floridae TaxID=7739 RepID=A0A9J7KAL4_BRAFL|nr:uncharacterized protein LOC118406991 [Branchiostoma floridae]